MSAPEEQQQPNSSNGGKFQLQFPIVSKIRGKKKVWMKSSNSVDKEDEECIPLTMTIHDSHSQGSLLDRISSLEDRILQLCSEIEMYKKSSSEISMSTDKSSGASSSSSSGSKMERMCSYPTFDIRNPPIRRLPRVVFNDNVTFQPENTNRQQQEQQIKISSSMKKQKQQKQPRGKKRDRKIGRNGKTNSSPSWPHLNLLGC